MCTNRGPNQYVPLYISVCPTMKCVQRGGGTGGRGGYRVAPPPSSAGCRALKHAPPHPPGGVEGPGGGGTGVTGGHTVNGATMFRYLHSHTTRKFMAHLPRAGGPWGRGTLRARPWPSTRHKQTTAGLRTLRYLRRAPAGESRRLVNGQPPSGECQPPSGEC